MPAKDSVRKRAKKAIAIPEILRGVVCSAADFAGEQATSVPSLLGDGVISPGTISILAGEDGVGKTMLALNLALSLAAGRDFLGLPVAGTCRVLFVEAEGNEAHFRDRLKTAATSLGIPLTGLDLILSFRQAYQLQLESEVLVELMRHYEPDVVIFDTAGYFCDIDENSATDWKRHVSKPLRKLATQWQAAFVLIQHLGKQKVGIPTKQRIRGSSAQSGDADTTLVLDHASGKEAKRILSFAKIKNGPRLEKVLLTFDEDAACFSLSGDSVAMAEEPRLGAIRETVLKAGSIGFGDLTSKVMELLTLKKRSAEKLIGKGLKAALYSRTKRGRYEPLVVTDEPKVAPPNSSLPQSSSAGKRAADTAEDRDNSSKAANARFAETAEANEAAQ